MIRKFLQNVLTLWLTLALNTKADAQQWNGLTLYSNMGSTLGYLVDTSGTTVKTWTFTGTTGYSTHMMPGGTIFRTVTNQGNTLTGGGMTGRIQKVDYSGNVLWDYVYSSSTYCMHHDHCPLPNANVLIISYDVKTAADATAAGCNSGITIWSEKIMELQPVGSNSAIVVWEWKVWDHLVQNTNPNGANYKSSIVDNPQLLNVNYSVQKDWLHMNGIDYNPLLDQIALSSHNLNEWYIIDHSTTTAEAASHSGGLSGKGGDFLYRWGNPAAYGASGTKILNVTHDAHWVPENCLDAGNLAGVNNRGVSSPANKTTADQALTPRLGYNYTITPGSAYTPSSFSKRHISTGYTSNMGSTEQYPNGNQMICLATAGSIYEIDANDNVLWTKSTGGTCPQAHRYSPCYISNAAPPQPSITVTGSVLSTANAASYQWYANGTSIPGATLQNYTHTATVTTVYVVKTTDANGCVYMVSAGQTFSVAPPPPPPPNDTKTIENVLEKAITLYPNPTNGLLNIDVNGLKNETLTLSVLDHSGRLLIKEKGAKHVNLNELSSGLYIIKITDEKGNTLNKKITLSK